MCMAKPLTLRGYKMRGGPEWGKVGDAFGHNTTREGEAAGVSSKRRESLGVLWRNWHPGPLLFQLAADALAFEYAAALRLALAAILAEPSPEARWPQSRQKLAGPLSLPPPLACDPTYCDAEYAPACVNFERPTFGPAGLKLLPPDDEFSPFAEEHDAAHRAWAWRPLDARNEGSGEGWAGVVETSKCVHKSVCGGYEVVGRDASPSQWLVLQLPGTVRLGHIAACFAVQGDEAAGARRR